MAEQAILAVEPRNKTGKGSARATRRAGMIPAVVYSHFADSLAIAVDPTILRKAVTGSERRFNTVLTLDVAGGEKKTALLRDWQVDPLSRRLLHADFLEIRMDEPLEADVPVVLVGKAEGVTAGGILSQVRREVTVKCLPGKIPAVIEIDVTHLNINDSFHVSDITPPADVELIYTVDYTLAVCSPPEKEPEPVTADAEGLVAAEGEAAEGAEGEGAEAGEGDGGGAEDSSE